MKRILIILMLLILFQFASYHWIGKKILLDQIEKSYTEFIDEIPDTIAIETCNNNILIPKSIYTDFNSIIRIQNLDRQKEEFHENTILYYLCTSNSFFGISTVEEAVALRNKDHGGWIGAGWKSTYFWCLFYWVKLDKVNTGIS